MKMINSCSIISAGLSVDLGYVMFYKLPDDRNRKYSMGNRVVLFDFITTRVSNQILANLKLK